MGQPLPETSTYTLCDFVQEMTRVVERTDSPAEQVTEAERLVARLLSEPSWLAPEYRQPAAQGYARYPLYCDPLNRFEVIALVWQPGQRTPLHDHDGTWGAEGVVAGRLTVTGFEQIENLPGARIRLKNHGTVLISAQETGQLLPPSDCHIVANDDEECAVTVHVYGKQLTAFRVFDETEEEGVYTYRESKVNCSFDNCGWFI